jgi:cytidyltransferase-like protein
MGKITKKDATKTTNTKKVTAVKKVTPKKAPDKKPVVKKTLVKAKAKVETPVVENTVKLKSITIPKTQSKENGVVVLVTGGFDPLHSGHLEYIEAAKELGKNDSWFGGKVVVGVNSDEWLTRKKGKAFMPVEERVRLLLAMRNVDQVITFNDDDDSSLNALHITRQLFPDEHIIFANGGDRTASNIKEMKFVDSNVSFAFGVGGGKSNSSSDILKAWYNQGSKPKTERDWGYYRVLHEWGNQTKLKELTVDPGKSLSMQRHESRGEFWFVAEGIASVYTVAFPKDPKRDIGDILVGRFNKHESTWINQGEWHQLVNRENIPLKLIEIQYGPECIEEDIERVFRNFKT